VASFKPKEKIATLSPVAEPTLQNYRNLLSNTVLIWFRNSVLVALLTMALGIFMATTAGFAISRYHVPGKRPLMWVFLITQMFPVAILIVPIYSIMSKLGLINTPWSLVIAHCTVAVPFCTWMLKGSFDTIPMDLDEAGSVDGLGPVRSVLAGGAAAGPPGPGRDRLLHLPDSLG